MRAEYINPFIASLNNTFLTMLECEVRRGKITLKNENAPWYDVSGIVGLSGKAIGTVVISLSKSVALKAASVMLLHEKSEIDDEVIDAVGELANMVTGAGKAEFEEYQLMASLPNVVTGRSHEVRFPSNVAPICVPFETDWGALSLEVGFAPAREPVAT